jgi:hypothetical protein
VGPEVNADMIRRMASVLKDEVPFETEQLCRELLAAALEGTPEICGYIYSKGDVCGSEHKPWKKHDFVPVRVVCWEQLDKGSER